MWDEIDAMKSTLRTIISLLFFAGWTLAALSLHVVRLNDGFIGLLPKDHLTITDTYLDVRPWTAIDVSAHPDFVRRVVQANRADWLKHLTKPDEGDPGGQLMDMLNAPPPTTEPAPAKASAKKAIAPPGQHR